MNTLVMNPIKSTKNLIQDALDVSMSYTEYSTMIHELAATKSNTGPDKTEALINYTQLNDRRMKRWDKTLKVSNEVMDEVNSIKEKRTWLVLTESWCGDASPSLPVMNKLTALNPNVDLKIVLRDEHPQLMDLFLTKGTRSIPKLIVLDTATNTVLGEWGPRSAKATKMVEEYKVEHGKLTSEFKQELQVFYNKDKGQDIINDLRGLFALK